MMKAFDAMQYSKKYLTERNIYFKEDVFEGVPRLTMRFEGFVQSPSESIEACLYYHVNAHAIEARVYYANPSPEIVKESAYIRDLYQLLNFTNSQVFPKNMDGADGAVYAPSYLMTPRFALTEDGCNDITAVIVMDEDLFMTAPLEICDYITIALPWLMDKLAFYIFGVLFGKLNVLHAIHLIRRYILQEEETLT